jgi:transaldolase/glucose-6-phosphate isomerase
MKLQELNALGQSVWLDYIRRHLVQSGELSTMIRDEGVRGVTSNPSIFEKAITGSTDYGDEINQLADRPAGEIYEQLAVEDIQAAADVLRSIYDEAEGADGFVSLEVSPLLAHDTHRTIEEARRLWNRTQRKNLLVKVPATPEGIVAIRQLLSEGINVNITLLFSRDAYAQVAAAYVDGLEALRARGGDLRAAASVASFFVSRIDVAIDKLIEEKLQGADPALAQKLRSLAGKAGIANARLAYQDFKQMLSDPRWQALAKLGARPQRLLWASTSTKDPRFSDVMYVESLIGQDTVDTIPPATLDAFRDHGRARLSIEDEIAEAKQVLASLEEVGISLESVTDRLLAEGVQSFQTAFEKITTAVEKKRAGATRPSVEHMRRSLPAALESAVEATLDDWQSNDKMRRLWTRDSTLWTGHDESKWVDWLDVVDRERGDEKALQDFADQVRQRGFTHVALLGMGGSSLCPHVLAETFGKQEGHPSLTILDSTDPAQIRAFEAGLDLPKTLFIVSSKSGTTLEPNLFGDYFYDRVRSVVGDAEAGSHFVVITDPGSRKLQDIAEQRGYWRVFQGVSGIGGRYSALSPFGVVPAAAMGLDVAAFLDTTEEMVHASRSFVPVRENPSAVLGVVLGVLGNAGHDKITFVASPRIAALGAWLEQLLAESTGKLSKGLIPIDREGIGAPEVYGDDRLFVYLRLSDAPDAAQDAAIAALEQAGQPVVQIAIPSPGHIGQAFFQWELATAVAGSILGINPFDQPDVEESKVIARNLADEYERTGKLSAQTPFHVEGSVALFADQKNQEALQEAAGSDRSLAGFLRAHLGRLREGDYFAVLAYLEENDPHHQALDVIRHSVRDAERVATCLGFGPRFQHSTGQAYKGGPNSGVFVQLTCDDANDVPVPGHRYTFGLIKSAQARGDLEVLGQRNRRALRVHLGSDVEAGLDTLSKALREAIG